MELFERPGVKTTGEGEKAVLLHVRSRTDESPEALDEFVELARSAGAAIESVLVVTRTQFDARTLIGSGKAEELRQEVEARGASLVIVNHDLSPSQERNLEKLLGCRVLDRAGLILDIFAQRARSHEGKLQVELAQLQHLSTRLVRGWTHLERQKGGIGLRGPGETQLETDRRLVAVRINQLKKRLEKVRAQRQEGRKGRQRAEVPTVALVGYTNAGKSTLFNRLTEAGVYAADQLFATLDATLRRVELPQGGAMVLADTVGFIADLPHELVAAFRSTLEETREADLLLHVIDAQSEGREERITEVESVLAQIGADEVPVLEVYNKIDLMGREPRIEVDEEGRPRRVWISAAKGLGLDLLIEAIEACLAEEIVRLDVSLTPAEARLRARLYAEGAITSERMDEEGGWHLGLRLPAVRWNQLLAHEPGLRLALDR
ncbi:ribosome rescue GTPase HflX [Thiofaba sp. EF100]|jgi:GTP-binding protein HflX|uniref:ribosome rescue GTPase HflX n=1 Tax=Thiofaba sp. EF100 TaxID=3121274 RepID=UPI003221E41A